MRNVEEVLNEEKYYLAGEYDLAVVGAGHAGCEAALAAARMGLKVVLFSMSLETIANLPCNPNIGGSAKGQIVREISALGGEMARVADKAGIQFRMLNSSKGPAVRAPRAQVDRSLYMDEMKHTLEKEENLHLRQAEIVELLSKKNANGKYEIEACVSMTNAIYKAKTFILTTGTYLDARIIIGETNYSSGPDNQRPAMDIIQSLRELELPLQRFKTGTPVRVNKKSIDFSKMEIQEGEEDPWTFSFLYGDDRLKEARKDQEACYITWTSSGTQSIIENNLYRSPLYGGEFHGVGARYCPSIEDKIVRFPDKDRHQVFVEPMGINTEEMYIQGLSSSLPEEIQLKFLKSVPGLENAVVQRTGYAIEYECINPYCLGADLNVKTVENLYTAGQINGTSGYEEAAGQGLIAGINAARKVLGKDKFVLDRSEAYIGVLIDDLVTEGTKEPYRMLSSRAEYRLILRQDNADLRLTDLGYELGLVSEKQYEGFKQRRLDLENEIARIEAVRVTPSEKVNKFLEAKGTSALNTGASLADLLRRPQIKYLDLAEIDPEIKTKDKVLIDSVENAIKYAGYIEIEQRRIDKFKKREQKILPEGIDYKAITGLRNEAKEKLDKMRPESIGQASRISGVSPADIGVLLVYLEAKEKQEKYNAKKG